MNREEKDAYLEKYKEEKEKGEPFFPYAVFKDALAALIVFLLLVALAYFIGTPLEPPADPADTMYTPKPEWYFLSVFQMLKYFPRRIRGRRRCNPSNDRDGASLLAAVSGPWTKAPLYG